MNFSVLRNKKKLLHKFLLTSALTFAMALAVGPIGVQAATSSVKVLTTPSIKASTIKKADSSDYTLEGWIKTCQKVGRNLTKYRFTYGNRSKRTYKAALKSGRKTNCALFVSWCLQEYGVSKKGDVFWTKKSGKISRKPKSWKGKVQIIRINKKASKANLKAGDIVCWQGIAHTNIYVGKNSSGQKTWIDGGSMATTRRGSRRYISADKIKVFNYLNKYKISYVIRIKGL